MKKIIVAAVVGFIVVGVVGIMAVQREQITRLQREVGWLQRDVHSLRSQAVALDKKVFRNFACLVANGKLAYGNITTSEGCTIKEIGNKNFSDWIEMSRDLEQGGWQLVNMRAEGLDEEERGELLNLLKENEIGGEKVSAIFNSGPTVAVRFYFYYVETMQDLKREEEKRHDYEQSWLR